MPALAKKASHRPLAGSSVFRRSANIEKDLSFGAESSFVLTTCVRRALARVLDAINDTAGCRAWTLTGPFGTGKSSFVLYLNRLLGAPSSVLTKSARRDLMGREKDLASKLEGPGVLRRGFVPISITGSREPFWVALKRGLMATLETTPARLAARVREDVGSATQATTSNAWLALFERAVGCLSQANDGQGVLVVLDELGKLLEFAARNAALSDVYLLQQLAEFATRASVPVVLIAVLHQDFAGYAQELPETERHEWDKVRGRFEDIIFEQSADDMLRLLAEARASDSRSANHRHSEQWLALCRAAWSSGIAPQSLDKQETVRLLSACHPLHPSVALLLGAVFKRFGQNERSAFSFLQSGEPNALLAFQVAQPPSALYTIVELYEYLVGIYGDSLLATRDGKRWAEAFAVEAKHAELSATELRVLRVIALLGMVSRWSGILVTPEALQFALAPAMRGADVSDALTSLTARSAVVHRRFNNTYNLWEGSDLDIEARIADARSRHGGPAHPAALLSGRFSPRPMVARRHSFETGTLRFFDVLFTSENTLAETLTASDDVTSDGHLLVMLPERATHDTEKQTAWAAACTARPDILLCLPGNARELNLLARELAAIDAVRKSTPELQGDATARRELGARDAEVRRRLEKAVSEMLSPHATGEAKPRWIYMGEDLKLRDQRALNEQLSLISNELFGCAPIIDNEIINRRDLSSSAAAARRNLIARMISHGDSDGLGIEGNPPERSIYLSVLRSLKIHQQRDGRWFFASTAAGVHKNAREVYKAIREFFDGADTEPRSLADLFSLLSRRPYGVRQGVIPILVTAALLGNDADIAVYESGAFLPQLSDAVFERLLKDPTRFSIRRWHVAGVRAAVFDQLATMLGKSRLGEEINRRDLLDVVKPLLRFVRKLQPFARQTRSLSATALRVREAITGASEPDLLVFRDLPQACGTQPFQPVKKERQADIDAFLRALQDALTELRLAYDRLLQSVTETTVLALNARPSAAFREQITERASRVRSVALEPDIKVFATRLADAAPDERTWAESFASFLASKHPTLWHDDDRARFLIRLKQLGAAFSALETLVDLPGASELADGTESIRIAVVGTQIGQAEYVLHLDAVENKRVTMIEKEATRLFDKYAQNGERKLAIAAIARLTRSLLNGAPANPSEVVHG